MSHGRAWLELAIAFGIASSAVAPAQGVGEWSGYGLAVADRFGRPVVDRGLVLTDWEGYVANPSVEMTLWANRPLQVPVKVTVRSESPFIYIDGSKMSETGAARELTLDTGAAPVAIHVAAFPDRNAVSEHSELHVEYCDALDRCGSRTVPITVRDLDPEPTYTREGSVYQMSTFPFVDVPNGHMFIDAPFPRLQEERRIESSHLTLGVDFTRNENDYFLDEKQREPVREAADDWGALFDSNSIPNVEPGGEQTSLFHVEKDGSTTEYAKVPNLVAYRGLMVYFSMSENSRLYQMIDKGHGKEKDMRMGGCFLKGGDGTWNVGGIPEGMRRSAQIILTRNGLGSGVLVYDEKDWWKIFYTDKHPVDLYSLAHHELGHLVIFNPKFTLMSQWVTAKQSSDHGVSYYLGREAKVTTEFHLTGEIDPESLLPAYGTPYAGSMPRGRWLITRLDLKVAGAMGYHVRNLSGMEDLAFPSQALPGAVEGAPYLHHLTLSGGVPEYYFSVDAGELPPGLELDSYTGEIRGSPTKAGTYAFAVTAHDSAETQMPLTRGLEMTVGARR